jgi:hypothetical protein
MIRVESQKDKNVESMINNLIKYCMGIYSSNNDGNLYQRKTPVYGQVGVRQKEYTKE